MKNLKEGHTRPVVILDAGHYGKFNRSPGIPEYYESEMNWKLHLMLQEELEKYGMEVKFTRLEQAEDLEVSARGRLAEDCDLLLSVHSNAVGSTMNEAVDYPVAYVPINGSANVLGKQLADCVAATMGTAQPGRISARQGNNGDYYGIIRGAVSVGTVGIILEHSFHTNTKSTRWLQEESNLRTMAQAEAEIIAAWFDVQLPEEKPVNLCGIYRVESSDGFLNLRSGNDVRYPVVEEMQAGTLVAVLGDSGNGWVLAMSQSGCAGYCNKVYLRRE